MLTILKIRKSLPEFNSYHPEIINIVQEHIKPGIMKKLTGNLNCWHDNLYIIRTTFFVLFLSFLFSGTYAQHEYREAPLNPEFIKYIRDYQEGRPGQYTPDGYKLDFIPSPVKLGFKNIPASGQLKSGEAFPGKFDLRDSNFVTVPKDQGGGTFGGNCVAFATMGSLESDWLRMGDRAYDLSEQNQAACYGFEWDYGTGATAIMPAAYLCRFDGPVLESQDPYNLNVHECNSSFNPVAFVPEVRWLPKDYDMLKRLLMDYGALPVSVHIDMSSYNDADKTYYYSGDEPANHAFLLCGWDDDKVTAGGTGAWIVKNSWGTSWADNGFVYVSYNDSKILSDITLYPYRWSTDDVDQIYMYDELGMVNTIRWETTATIFDYANAIVKFRTLKNQLITRIGTYTNTQGTRLDIRVYREFDGKRLTGIIDSLENIYVEYPGYHTFSLPFEVNGDFYIMIRYYTPGSYYPLPVEKYEQSDGEEWADPVIEKNVCWWGVQDTAWNMMDTLTEPANLCIRAYARNTNRISATVESDKEVSCLNSTVTFTAVTTGSPTAFRWDFGTDANPSAATTEGPHEVTYSSTGNKRVRLIVSGTGGTDTTILYNAVDIVDRITVNVERDTIETPARIALDLKAYGADTYIWEPADYLDKTTGNIVRLTPMTDGVFNYTVTGTQGDCSDSKTISVISNPRPLNDDVCEAIQIRPGGWIGKFTNAHATVQSNEPAPETGPGGCTTPLMWCTEAEGKLQHTIWFWFYGPETNQISIDTRGFDDQIAVYRAESCTDILNGNYLLVAANDDYYPADKQNAAAIEVMLALYDVKYFVQVDGSFGGQEGIMDLIFMAYPLGQQEISGQLNDLVSVYPNPGNGLFTIEVTNRTAGSLGIEVYSSNGRLIMKESYNDAKPVYTETLDLSGQPGGIYYMRIITGKTVSCRKLVIN